MIKVSSCWSKRVQNRDQFWETTILVLTQRCGRLQLRICKKVNLTTQSICWKLSIPVRKVTRGELSMLSNVISDGHTARGIDCRKASHFSKMHLGYRPTR